MIDMMKLWKKETNTYRPATTREPMIPCRRGCRHESCRTIGRRDRSVFASVFIREILVIRESKMCRRGLAEFVFQK